MRSILASTTGLLFIWLLCSIDALEFSPQEDAGTLRFWKGNTHTHSLWSDGNAAPEWITHWYRDHGYQFLVLSDHNILSQGEKYFRIDDSGRLQSHHIDELRATFGEDRVRLRGEPGSLEMKLWNLDELREHFELPDQFLLIQGEEVTDAFQRFPVHINALNIAEVIPPSGGGSVLETLQNNLDAIRAHGEKIGRPVLGHINHPNFRFGVSWREVAAVKGERFFEVYNGHSGVQNQGDDSHPSTETLWDLALTERLGKTGLGLLYGVATDDSHDYYSWGVGKTNPGRGWVMVRAARLEADALIRAMRAGDFYASTGVTLDFRFEAGTYHVDIDGEERLRYRTEFIGTRRTDGELGRPGEVLSAQEGWTPSYTLKGDELYVRATVTSSRLHPNPFAEGDFEQAWVQPVRGEEAMQESR